MADVRQLERLIEPVVQAAGFELVRVALIHGPSLTLQVMLEDPATGQMLVDDCARVSRKISAALDAADPIDGEYLLEVSSPGIDRPLTRLKDFDRWVGHLARVEMAESVALHGADRKRFQGPILGTVGEEVRIDVEGLGPTGLPFAGIRAAKLLLTDALIAASHPLSTQGADEIEEDNEDMTGTDDTPEALKN
ncbi:MAG: ribosome maturation factor [Sandarakinorhabdus sp.]|nr:ribosome maturation factor [Sandarakinorhabdus sp.]